MPTMKALVKSKTEVGVWLAGDCAVDPVLAGVVCGERERPLAVAGAQMT